MVQKSWVLVLSFSFYISFLASSLSFCLCLCFLVFSLSLFCLLLFGFSGSDYVSPFSKWEILSVNFIFVSGPHPAVFSGYTSVLRSDSWWCSGDICFAGDLKQGQQHLRKHLTSILSLQFWLFLRPTVFPFSFSRNPYDWMLILLMLIYKSFFSSIFMISFISFPWDHKFRF